MFNRKRTHKKRKIKAKGLRNILFRRRTTLRHQQRMTRQMHPIEKKKKDILKKTLENLIATHPKGSNKPPIGLKSFKYWASKAKDKPLNRTGKRLTLEQHIHEEIEDQFVTDKGRLTYLINGKVVDLNNRDKENAITIIKKSQTNKENIKDLLFWGTQSSTNFIKNYLQTIIHGVTDQGRLSYVMNGKKNLLGKVITSERGDDWQMFISSRVKRINVSKDNLNTCINYENKKITIIYDFSISYPAEAFEECSLKIVINSPFKLNNIVEFSISRDINECAKSVWKNKYKSPITEVTASHNLVDDYKQQSED